MSSCDINEMATIGIGLLVILAVTWGWLRRIERKLDRLTSIAKTCHKEEDADCEDSIESNK